VDLTNGHWRIMDVNGDAVPDVIATVPSGNSSFHTSVFMNLKQGDHGVPLLPPIGTDAGMPVFQIPVPIKGLPIIDVNDNAQGYTGAHWADFTGDGRPDILAGARVIGEVTQVVSYVNNGYGWQAASGGFATPPVGPFTLKNCVNTSGGGMRQTGQSKLVDVNGDGLLDIIWAETADTVSCTEALWAELWTTRQVFLNNGSGWDPEPHPAWSAAWSELVDQIGHADDSVMFFDANGDGLADAGQEHTHGSREHWGTVWLNTGRDWSIEQTELTNLGPIADVNGDGFVDRAVDSGYTPPSALSRGSDLVDVTFSMPFVQNWCFGACQGARLLTDIDGDGQVDVIFADGTDFEVHLAENELPDDLLTRVEQSFGATFDISYTATGAGSCWDAGGAGNVPEPGGCNIVKIQWELANVPSCRFPMFRNVSAGLCSYGVETLPMTLQTVSGITSDDQNGNVAYNDTRYDRGYFDPGEREFRGFGVATERPQKLQYANPKNSEETIDLGIVRITEYYQLGFMRGMKARSEVWKSSDGLLDSPGTEDTLLSKKVPQYAVTRGDATKTLLIESGSSTLLCDPMLSDVLDPTSQSECPFRNIDGSAYEAVTQNGGASSLPFQDFRSAFENSTNRDRSFAYLVTDIGQISQEVNGSITTERQEWRWHDDRGNVQAEWNWGDVSNIGDDRFTSYQFARPIENGGGPSNLVNLPNRIIEYLVDADPANESAALTEATTRYFFYDGLAQEGEVTKGNLTLELMELRDPVNSLDTQVFSTRAYGADTYGLPESTADLTEIGDVLRVTLLEYDASNTFVTSKTRGGLTITTGYDPPGAPAGLGIKHKQTGTNDITVTYGADPFGRATSTSAPNSAGEVESKAYDDFFGFDPNRPRETITRRDGSGNVTGTYLYFDGLGRVIRSEADGLGVGDAPATIVVETAFDVMGRAYSASRAYLAGGESPAKSVIHYDERGRSRFLVLPNGGIGEVQYQGLQISAISPEGRRRDRVVDGSGTLVEITEHSGGSATTTRYIRDTLGRLVRICDPLASACSVETGDPRHSVEITYDSLSRRVRLADPDTGTWTYRYDGAGRITTQTDARGVSIGYTYDAAHGRRAGEDLDGDANPDITYLYGDQQSPVPPNAKGRLVEVASPEGSFFYSYDSRGRVSERSADFGSGSGPYSTSFEYDWFGRVTQTTYPDGEVVSQVYDGMGVDQISSPARTYVADVQHNESGHPTVISLGDGSQRRQTYFADSGYVESIVAGPAGAPAFLDRTYSYDLTGKLNTLIDGIDPSESLTNVLYDGVGRLDSLSRGGSESLDYDYDTLGNLISKDALSLPYEHPSKPHAVYDPADPARWDYDENGNMIRRNAEVLHYDARNRLVAITGSLPTSFGYDFTGERVRAAHGADTSHFTSRDYEIRNGVRFIKTIRIGELVVAQVSLGPAVATSELSFYGLPISPDAGILGLAILILLSAAMGIQSGGVPAPAWRRAVAAGLCGALLGTTTLSLTASAAEKGDVSRDGSLDSADALLLKRAMRAETTLDAEQSEAADVAPMSAGEVLGDGELNAADILLVLRALRGEDVDGDGLSTKHENRFGTSPFSQDSDGDGIHDASEDPDGDGLTTGAELLAGTDPLDSDSDADGFVDGLDEDPLTSAGDLVHFVHADHLGSASVITDANGEVVRRLQYGPWGSQRLNQAVTVSEGSDPSEGYTGQRYSSGTGLLYYGARFYDPEIGRFIQPDSMVPDPTSPQTLNRYTYVRNDPLNRTDPTGNFSIGGFFGGVGRAIGGAFSAIGNFFGAIGSAISGFFAKAQSFVTQAISFARSLVAQSLDAAWRASMALRNTLQAIRNTVQAKIVNPIQQWQKKMEAQGGLAGNLAKLVGDDVKGIYGFLVSRVVLPARGLSRIARVFYYDNPADIGRGISDLVGTALPAYGAQTGWAWSGIKGKLYAPTVDNHLGYSANWHDGQSLFLSSSQFGWVARAWLGPDGRFTAGDVSGLGPYGQAVRAVGTVAFTTIGIIQLGVEFLSRP
jgi:RHS repeat-associated protein